MRFRVVLAVVNLHHVKRWQLWPETDSNNKVEARNISWLRTASEWPWLCNIGGMRRMLVAMLVTCLGGGLGLGLSRAQATPSVVPASATVAAGDVALVRGLRVVGQVPDAVRNLISAQIGSIADTERLVADREQVLDGMISRGYLDAQVQLSRDNADDGGMFVKFSVKPGPLYRISAVAARGRMVDISALTTLSVDDIADADRIERNRMMVEQSLTRRAGKRIAVLAEVQPNRADHTVAVTYRISTTK